LNRNLTTLLPSGGWLSDVRSTAGRSAARCHNTKRRRKATRSFQPVPSGGWRSDVHSTFLEHSTFQGSALPTCKRGKPHTVRPSRPSYCLAAMTPQQLRNKPEKSERPEGEPSGAELRGHTKENTRTDTHPVSEVHIRGNESSQHQRAGEGWSHGACAQRLAAAARRRSMGVISPRCMRRLRCAN
jgi:hypothetical protein